MRSGWCSCARRKSGFGVHSFQHPIITRPEDRPHELHVHFVVFDYQNSLVFHGEIPLQVVLRTLTCARIIETWLAFGPNAMGIAIPRVHTGIPSKSLSSAIRSGYVAKWEG